MRNRWFHTPRLHSSLKPVKKVSWLELFFDVIFVAAMLQLGDLLSTRVHAGADLLWSLGAFAAQVTPLWLVWTGFSTFENRFDVDDFIHRCLTFALLFAVGSAAVFAGDASAVGLSAGFATSVAAAWALLGVLFARTRWQLVRHPSSTTSDIDDEHAHDAADGADALAVDYAGFWATCFLAAAVLWQVSTWTSSTVRVVLWVVAVVMVLAGPLSTSSRALRERHPLDMAHLSRRFGLLIVVVLGMAFVKLLATLMAQQQHTTQSLVEAGLSLLVLTCLWWIYFDDVAGSRLRPQRVAWFAWFYGHLPLTIALSATGIALQRAAFVVDFAQPTPDVARWMLTSSLSLALFAVAVIDSVTERRQAELSDRARVNVRAFSGMVVLVVGGAGGNISAAWFFVVISAVLLGQVLFDMLSAPTSDDDVTKTSSPIAELAQKRLQGQAPKTRSRLDKTLRKGAPAELRSDLYFFFMEGSWWRLFASFLVLYLVGNAAFAGLYLLEPGAIGGREAITFSEAFAFSVQTMSTIGYGSMSPATAYGDLVVTIEAAVGLLGVAMATGIMFAKVSRPKSSVLFSDNLVLTRRHGQDTLMFRVGNARGNEIVDANMTVTALLEDISPEGHHMRRLVDLKLVRDRTPVFTLSWSVMHVVDEDSPLHGIDFHKEDTLLVSIIAALVGHDGTYGQTTYARHIYQPTDVAVGKQFVDVIHQLDDGRFLMDYSAFHDLVDAPGSD